MKRIPEDYQLAGETFQQFKTRIGEPTPEQIRDAIRMICDAIVEAVKVAGPLGAPAGVMYAAMMGGGCTLDEFNQFTSALVQCGKIRRQGDLFFSVEGAPK